jgi:hypothetical protein
MHETTKLNIEKMNEKYRIAVSKGRKEVKLEPGDLVWLHLRKEQFPKLRKSKLMSRAATPFKILAKINDNTYKLELPPESMKIKLLNSSPYYAQTNGQAKASNKVLIEIIKKRIKDNPRRWHKKLSEALWAHRISRHGAMRVTPFNLVYGQEVVLPLEIGLQTLRVTGKGSLSAVTP